MKRFAVAVAAVFLGVTALFGQVRIGGNSRIIHDGSADGTRAAAVLERYVSEALDSRLKVLPGGKSRQGDIVIRTVPGLGEDAFRVRTEGGVLLLEGEGKALVYAACDFLEQELGMDYWGDGEYLLPKAGKVLETGPLDRLEKPAFNFRQTQSYMLHRVGAATSGESRASVTDDLYRYWYRLEEPSDVFVDNLWVHTFNRLLPASRYGAAHPEYYAFFKGERHPGSAGQWCLSNPDVLEIVCSRIDSLFRANPGLNTISVSQNDGSDTYCRCPDCQRIIDEEGSPSGPMIRFVNAVAARFPDKQISTLAYLFTMVPPRVTRPLPNVNVMLCDIDCRRQTSLPENPSGQEFMKCLEGWSAVTDNIFLWDYGINFDNYLSPFPNLHTLADNMRIFQDHGVKMHFSQIGNTRGGDLAELRPYLVSKLMWNPRASADSLIRHFCAGYYGDAAPFIERYISLLEGACIGADTDLFIYDTPVSYKNGMLKPELMARYNRLFDEAEAAVAGDSVRLMRVRRSRLPLKYSALEIARTLPDRDNAAVEAALADFEADVRRFGVKSLNERNNSPLEYCGLYRERFLGDARDNLAYGCSVTYVKPPHERYAEMAVTALTDGLYGGNGFRENWVGWEGTDGEMVVDLGRVCTVRQISADFLRQGGAWVLEPEAVSFAVSEDGSSFVPFGTVGLPENRDLKIGFRDVSVTASPVQARYVKIEVTGVKQCPEWHFGVGNPCWFFVDEVVVR